MAESSAGTLMQYRSRYCRQLKIKMVALEKMMVILHFSIPFYVVFYYQNAKKKLS